MGAYCLKKDSTAERFAEKVLYLPKMRNTCLLYTSDAADEL